MALDEHKQHRHQAQCLIITVSDTRTDETDKSGDIISSLLTSSDHHVLNRVIVPDELEDIKQALQTGCSDPEINAIVVNGGTGIAKRDVTIEAVESLIEKDMPGFGEIFRLLSFQEDIGTAAILSRAMAGINNDTIIFSVPGSSGAVKLAMKKLILPEISHVLHELRKN